MVAIPFYCSIVLFFASFTCFLYESSTHLCIFMSPPLSSVKGSWHFKINQENDLLTLVHALIVLPPHHQSENEPWRTTCLSFPLNM
uniref:Uncharacterized protein n=1 Tax=Arundo donax TaxID=35708 RepID=A0A0A9ELE6_ARUDO